MNTVEHPFAFDPPMAPRTIEELGLPVALVEDLVLRRLAHDGRGRISEVSAKLAIGLPIVESVVMELRDRKLVSFLGAADRDMAIEPTEAGLTAARRSQDRNSYMGVAPVSLVDYAHVVRSQTVRYIVTSDHLQAAFRDLVLDPEIVNRLGASLAGTGAMFLYGPPGTGKSSIADRLVSVYGDIVLIPRALEVDGQIVGIYDPSVHIPVEVDMRGRDQRWIPCRRPCVKVGGEMTSAMMEISRDATTGSQMAPLQLKANNGVLVIDDFGRQAMTPAEMLNRWIVPLDRGIDYLTLFGVSFEVPFEVRVVFSTNLEPSTLGDGAFFRRIPTKIHINSISEEIFNAIFDQALATNEVTVDDGGRQRVIEVVRAAGDGDLRPHLAVVFAEMTKWLCSYERREALLTADMADRVADMHFGETHILGTDQHPVAQDEVAKNLMTMLKALDPGSDAPRGGLHPMRRVSDRVS